MESVAERKHLRGLVSFDQGSEPQEGCARVIRRQRRATAGEVGALFKMHVGDDERLALRPEERAVAERF